MFDGADAFRLLAVGCVLRLFVGYARSYSVIIICHIAGFKSDVASCHHTFFAPAMTMMQLLSRFCPYIALGKAKLYVTDNKRVRLLYCLLISSGTTRGMQVCKGEKGDSVIY